MPENDDLLRALDGMDLENMTVAQVRAVNNPVLRRVLLNSLSDLTAAVQHVSHGQHTSHAKSEALDLPFDNPVVQPGNN